MSNLKFAPLLFRYHQARFSLPFAASLLIVISAQAGNPVNAPRAIAASSAQGQSPSGEAIVVLDENLLNAFLAGVFRTGGALTYPLGGGANSRECSSEIELVPEAAGTRTSVRFDGNRMLIPLAFRGSYNAGRLGCPRFTGSSIAAVNLYFDEERQALSARVEVQDLSIRNLPFLVAGSIRSVVQDAINRRFNPVTLLRLDQLTTRFTLKEGATLNAHALNIQPEINGRELRLRIRYEFGN